MRLPQLAESSLSRESAIGQKRPVAKGRFQLKVDKGALAELVFLS